MVWASPEVIAAGRSPGTTQFQVAALRRLAYAAQPMRIQFCGADRTVTGSSHLIEVNGLRILLDLGMYQGPRDEARRINALLPEGYPSLDAIILSHGHL